MFSLSFVENPDTGRFSFDTDTEMLGKIVLNDFEEYFVANTTLWSADEYRAQWLDGLSRTCDGAEKSCVLTSVSRPEAADWFIMVDIPVRQRVDIPEPAPGAGSGGEAFSVQPGV